MTAAEVRTVSLFTANDRCDCCPAQATTRVVLWNDLDVVFCDHHLRRFRGALTPMTKQFERHVELDEALPFVPAPARR